LAVDQRKVVRDDAERWQEKQGENSMRGQSPLFRYAGAGQPGQNHKKKRKQRDELPSIAREERPDCQKRKFYKSGKTEARGTGET